MNAIHATTKVKHFQTANKNVVYIQFDSNDETNVCTYTLFLVNSIESATTKNKRLTKFILLYRSKFTQQ